MRSDVHTSLASIALLKSSLDVDSDGDDSFSIIRIASIAMLLRSVSFTSCSVV
jgi:hypothetical protein